MAELPSRLTIDQAADLLGTDLNAVRQLIATGRVEVHQVCSGRCETLIDRDSLLAHRPQIPLARQNPDLVGPGNVGFR